MSAHVYKTNINIKAFVTTQAHMIYPERIARYRRIAFIEPYPDY